MRSRASSCIAAASRSRSSSSFSLRSSRSISAAMSRSPCGMRSSARATTSAGSASRRAMLMPYERPGTPLMRRYVGASSTASNCSDALTTAGTCVASSLSWPRCVDASVVAPRAVSDSRMAQPSAAPSCGSVPDPSSSMRTSESRVARRRISLRFLRCALNVERLASIDCSSPTSAKHVVEHGNAALGADRRGDAGLTHRRDETERLEQHGLAAGVRSRHEQRALLGDEREVERDDVDALREQQRMTADRESRSRRAPARASPACTRTSRRSAHARTASRAPRARRASRSSRRDAGEARSVSSRRMRSTSSSPRSRARGCGCRTRSPPAAR